MRETILLAPGANGTELLRTLARFGKNSFGLRVMNAAELSKFALMKSGVVTDSDFLPRKQEATVIDSFIRDITYFKSASFVDSEKIAAALFSMRSLICKNEFETVHTVFQNGEFTEKNKSLISVYDRYISVLNADKLIDAGHYPVKRIMSWLFPSNPKYSGVAIQQQNSIMAIGSGPVWGKGLNNSVATSMKNSNYIINHFVKQQCRERS